MLFNWYIKNKRHLLCGFNFDGHFDLKFVICMFCFICWFFFFLRFYMANNMKIFSLWLNRNLTRPASNVYYFRYCLLYHCLLDFRNRDVHIRIMSHPIFVFFDFFKYKKWKLISWLDWEYSHSRSEIEKKSCHQDMADVTTVHYSIFCFF